MKSFLMVGQSNMAGRGFLQDVEPIVNERIHMLRNGRFQMMVEPINPDRANAGVSLAASFAEAWAQQHPTESIGLIPSAEGGSSIDEWDVNGTLFKHAIMEAKFAMEQSELAGILWHQGESDSMEGKHKDYYSKLKQIMTAFRDELNASDIPIIIGGLGDFLGKEKFGAYATEYKEINQEIERFVENHEHYYFVTGANFTTNPDGIHMDAESLRGFGLRYFEAFSNKADVKEPLENESQLVEQLYSRENTPSEKQYLFTQKFVEGKISFEEFMKESEKLKSHL